MWAARRGVRAETFGTAVTMVARTRYASDKRGEKDWEGKE